MSAHLPIEISPEESARLVAGADGPPAVLLDCRTPEEHAIARIAGAILVPMPEIPERLAEFEEWRSRTIVVHCHHGMRSLRVAQWLRERGFPAVTSMRGGIDAWSATIDPSVPVY